MKIYIEQRDSVWVLYHEDSEPFAWFRFRNDAVIYCAAAGMNMVEVNEGG